MSIKDKYQNGKIPADALKPIDTGQLLEENASYSYMRMKNDAKKEGVIIDLTGKSSGYRICGNKGDYTQGSSNGLFTQWYAWELYKSGKGNLASNPTTSKGCKSNHGWGIAIDVNRNAGARDWIRKNGEKYGWWWSGGTFSKIEDWHFDYDKNRDTYLKENPVILSGEYLNITPKNAQLFKVSGFSLILLSVVGLTYSIYYFSKK